MSRVRLGKKRLDNMKNGIDYTKYHDGYHGGFCAKNDQVLEVGKKKTVPFSTRLPH